MDDNERILLEPDGLATVWELMCECIKIITGDVNVKDLGDLQAQIEALRSALEGKSPTGHTHTAADVGAVALTAVANNDTTTAAGHVADARIVKAHGGEIDAISAALAAHKSSSDHDGRYYTETEVNNLLAGKSATGHKHTKSQITDFPSSMPASDVYSWAKASSKPSYSWNEITGKPSTYAPSTHTHDYIPLAGSSAITGNLEFSNSGTNARGIIGTNGDNDFWRIIGCATGNNSGYLEIATADDGNEPIYVRQYSGGKFVTLARTLTLLDGSGNTAFPGQVYCNGGDVTLKGPSMTNTIRTRHVDGNSAWGNSDLFLNYNCNGTIYCRGTNVNIDSGNFGDYGVSKNGGNFLGDVQFHNVMTTFHAGANIGQDTYCNRLHAGYLENSDHWCTGTIHIRPDNTSLYGAGSVRFQSAGFAPGTDNHSVLGYGDYRWKTVYAATGTINTSDRNMKDDIAPLTEQHYEFFLKLAPVSFTFTDGESGRTHIGFISQDVEEAMAEVGLTDLDFAGFCKDVKTRCIVERDDEGVIVSERTEEVLDADGNPEYIYSLRYQEFVALIAHALQRTISRTERLEERMERLEAMLPAA